MSKKFKVDFPICNNPLHPPIKTEGNCPIHDYMCPICGFGVGGYYGCGCPEMRKRYFKLWEPKQENELAISM